MSLRVAGKIAPASVVTFAKGVTLGCMLRLVWHDFAKQRGSRMKCQQTLACRAAHAHAFLQRFEKVQQQFIGASAVVFVPHAAKIRAKL